MTKPLNYDYILKSILHPKMFIKYNYACKRRIKYNTYEKALDEYNSLLESLKHYYGHDGKHIIIDYDLKTYGDNTINNE